MLFGIGKLVDPRIEHRMNRLWNRDVFDRCHQLIRFAGAGEVAAVDERLNDFFDEERVAIATFVNRLREFAQTRVISEQVLQKLRRAGFVEREKRELLVVRSIHPRSVVVRAKVNQQHGLGARDRLDEFFQEQLAARIEPMKIFEQEDTALLAVLCMEQTRDDPEQAALTRVRVQWDRVVVRVGNSQKLKQQREAFD